MATPSVSTACGCTSCFSRWTQQTCPRCTRKLRRYKEFAKSTQLDALIEELVLSSNHNGLICDFRHRKAEAERLDRRARIDCLEIGQKVDFLTKTYVWHPGVVKRLRVDPVNLKVKALIALLVG